jgi:U3 small nucleolar RNA-associated protein 10
MTSLAKQLRSLQVRSDGVHGAGVTEGGASKPSLLFNQREAASLDLDDAFELGVNGLLELGQLDERFNVFQQSLFSAGARRTEREGQVKLVRIIRDVFVWCFVSIWSTSFACTDCR